MSTAVTEAQLLEALKTVTDPNTGKDFVSTRQVKNLRIEGGDIAFDVELGYPGKSQVAGLRKALIAAARTLPGLGNVSLEFYLDDGDGIFEPVPALGADIFIDTTITNAAGAAAF